MDAYRFIREDNTPIGNFLLCYADRFVEREEVVEERRRDYKTLLQEHIQRKAGQELTYCMVREEGPDHAKTFVTEVRLNGAAIGEGSGHSKKESEQMAAKSALEKLDNQ